MKIKSTSINSPTRQSVNSNYITYLYATQLASILIFANILFDPDPDVNCLGFLNVFLLSKVTDFITHIFSLPSVNHCTYVCIPYTRILKD